MKYCPYCENILLPKNKRLFCKVCEAFFDFEITIADYTVIQKIRHVDNEFDTAIVNEGTKIDKISSNDRKAFEDFFNFHN